MLGKDSKPSYTKDDTMLIDDLSIEVDDSIKLNFVRILEKDNVIRKSSGKHLRSIAEASQDTGSGIYIDDGHGYFRQRTSTDTSKYG